MLTPLKSYRCALVLVSMICTPFSAQADVLGEAQPAPQSLLDSAAQSPRSPETKKEATPSAASSSEPEEGDISGDEGPNDPLEPLNRLIFAVNHLVDFVILHPAAEIYRAIIPEPVRSGVSNVLDNLFTPLSFLNHILQGEPERATATLFRFLTNSTFGLLGLVDVNSAIGFPRYDTDFNQTLTVWGIDTGPYLVLPLIGPSCFRGSLGFVGDYYADPLNLYLTNRHHRKDRYWLTIRYGVDMLRHREKVIETLENLEKNSLDFYVTMRSIYFQRQNYMAKNLKTAPTQDTNSAK